jgi:hypothetical protein
MVHPLYIAPDEEIISVIARLRAMEEPEVTLVFPKTSSVTQSIINLKLLAREGEKLQKQIVIVSQSENARNLAEKLGFTTLPYTQDFEQKNFSFSGTAFEATETTPEAAPSFVPPVTAEDTVSIARPRSSEIGSSTFHIAKEAAPLGKKIGDIKAKVPSAPALVSEAALAAGAAEALTMPLPEVVPEPVQEVPAEQVPAPTTLRVRNMTPERPPGLNSVRFQEAQAAQEEASLPVAPPEPMPPANESPFGRSAHSFEVPVMPPAPVEPTHQKPSIKDFVPFVATDTPVSKASFATKEALFTPKEAKEIPAATPVTVPAGRTLRLALFGFGALVILTSIAVFLFLTLPSAEVKITAQTVEDAVDQSYTVPLNGGGDIALEKTTEEVTVSIPGIASGASGATTSGSSAGRARGTLTITNSYSSEAQTLVATTRFEATDGKIYRLVQAATVPGNGSVTAEVVADQAGGEYNKEHDTFTIPGFKGSDKYAKFSATVATALAGGEGKTTVASSSSATFIRADQDTLRSRAAEAAKTQFTDGLSNDEQEETHTFTDGLVTEMVSEQNMPKVNSVPGDYTYTATYKVTAYTVSTADVKKLLVKNMKTDYDGINFVPKEQKLSFTDFTVDEKASSASLKAHLDATLIATLNTSALKQDLAGKSASELSAITQKHPEVKNLEVIFRPSWALKRIPGNTEKITITEVTE